MDVGRGTTPEGGQLVENEGEPQLVHLRKKLVKLVSSSFPSLCIVFQSLRLVSLVMFSIFLADCVLTHGSSSVDCKNFTVYGIPVCGPYYWKTVWLICSILTSTVFICLLHSSLLPELRPVKNKFIFKRLIQKPYFWSLNGSAVLVVIYDALIIFDNKDASILILCSVIISKLWTLYLLYQLNFTFPPCTQKGYRRISRAAYNITLFIYVLDNLCKFLMDSTQVAFKFYTVKDNSPKPVTILNLMLMIINASFYHSLSHFFWQKLFRGDKDILKVLKENFVDTTEINERTHTE